MVLTYLSAPDSGLGPARGGVDMVRAVVAEDGSLDASPKNYVLH